MLPRRPQSGCAAAVMEAKLTELGQGHLLEGLTNDKLAALLAQAGDLDTQLPGGLAGYIASAKKLLQDSKVAPSLTPNASRAAVRMQAAPI